MTTLVTTPREWLGPLRRETILIEGRTYLIDRPTDTDATLEPVGGAQGRYMPYWVDLWPGARMLAKWIARQQWPAGLRALEVGCGLGLPGVVALSLGLHVTFSDCDSTALEFAAANAKLNQGSEFDTLHMAWEEPIDLRFPLILASEVVYETRHAGLLLALIERMLAPGGMCLVTDLDRAAGALRKALHERQLTFTEQSLKASEPSGHRSRGTLYHIGAAKRLSIATS